ncbi:MAG: Zinc-type alcohol dehydrogenase-like protein, partial [Olavius algarvensis Gamma 1 endosymbiont]
TYGPFATSASRSRLRLPRTTRLALRASLAGSAGAGGHGLDRGQGRGRGARYRRPGGPGPNHTGHGPLRGPGHHPATGAGSGLEGGAQSQPAHRLRADADAHAARIARGAGAPGGDPAPLRRMDRCRQAPHPGCRDLPPRTGRRCPLPHRGRPHPGQIGAYRGL